MDLSVAMMSPNSGLNKVAKEPPPNDRGFFNAKKLAELVQIQKEKEVRDLMLVSSTTDDPDRRKKRPFPELELDLTKILKEKIISGLQQNEDHEQQRLQTERRSSSEDSKFHALSPAESHGSDSTNVSSGNGSLAGSVEDKKRRLDALLSRKFSNSSSASTTSTIRMSTENGRSGANKRKPSSPTSSNSSLNSSPPPLAVKKPKLPLGPPPEITIPASISVKAVKRSKKPEKNGLLMMANKEQEKLQPNQDFLKNQLLQLQLAQAALLGVPQTGNDPATAMMANPLLYYGYYAQQMLQGLQTQQTKIFDQMIKKETSPKKVHRRRSQKEPRKESLRDLLNNHTPNKMNNDLNSLAMLGLRSLIPTSTPNRSTPGSTRQHLNEFEDLTLKSQFESELPSTPPKSDARTPKSQKNEDEDSLADDTFEEELNLGGDTNTSGSTRKRAPRALTGRYVRPGTGASKSTLQILRKKLLERMRLKELLGENSDLYFGPLNKQRGGAAKRASIEAKKRALLASL